MDEPQTHARREFEPIQLLPDPVAMAHSARVADNRFALAAALEQAEATLAHAFGEGVIDEDELDERLERLAHANRLDEVERLTHDLEPAPASSLAPVEARSPSLAPNPVALARSEDLRPEQRMLAIFSEQKRRGDWLVARRNQIVSVLGSATLDFRGVSLPPGETEVHVRGFLSETTIIVPPGMRVVAECSTILGEVEQDESFGDSPAHPAHLRVTGLVVLGSVEIKERELGESKGEARRRRRRERRALRKAEKKRRALRRGD